MGHRAIKAKYGSIKKFKAAQARAAANHESLPSLEWQSPKIGTVGTVGANGRREWKPRHREVS